MGARGRVAQVAQDIATAADIAGMRLSGPVPLPTRHRKFALLRSPFKHKKSYEHFEIRTHRRLILVEGTPDAVRRFVEYSIDNIEPIASIKVREHHYHRLRPFWTNPVAAAEGQTSASAALGEARAAALGAAPSYSSSSSAISSS